MFIDRFATTLGSTRIDEISRDEPGSFSKTGDKERKKERIDESRVNDTIQRQISAFEGIAIKSHVPRRQTVSREFLKGAHSTIDVKIIVIAGVYETYLVNSIKTYG